MENYNKITDVLEQYGFIKDRKRCKCKGDVYLRITLDRVIKIRIKNKNWELIENQQIKRYGKIETMASEISEYMVQN